MPEKAKVEPVVLGSAGASSDPAVQDLVAQRAGAFLNGDDKAIERIDQKLAKLGVTV